MKYINISFFSVLLIIYMALFPNIKFSTNFLEIFFSKNSMETFEIAKQLGYQNEILIATKGFDKNSSKTLYEIATKLQKLPQIKTLKLSLAPSRELKKYIKKHYYIVADFNNTKIKPQDIKKSLTSLYKKITTDVIYEPINTNDPLNLFNYSTQQDIQTSLVLKNYGYMLRARTNIDTADASKAKTLYKEIKNIIKPYKDTIAFSPFFYLVENSSYIRTDAQRIMGISTILLLLLYFFILRNPKLFIHTLITIGSSILGAILLSHFLFGSISILALVFGISISTVSVDYMFHYYFHKEFSKTKPIFSKKVFFGFLTSFGVFVIFSFIDVKLFAQLAFFSATSLLIAYTLFSIAFVYLDIKEPDIQIRNSSRHTFKPIYIITLSFLMLSYSYKNLHFDTNLKNLDYKNEKLMQLSKKFKEASTTKEYKMLLISAKDRETLLQKYETLNSKYPDMIGVGKFVYSQKKCNKKLQKLKEYDFAKLKEYINIYAKEIGFRDIFKNSYTGIDKMECTNMKTLDNMDFKIIQNKKGFHTLAFIKKEQHIKPQDGVKILNLASTLSKDTEKMRDTLLKYLFISIAFIIFMLYLVAKKELLYPLSYLLFPISSALFAISITSEINIMHIFALIIMVALGIDYGIYMYKAKSTYATKIAIKYALLSTFCGFGVLIFSSTSAMYSIGFVITISIVSISILLLP